MVEELPLKILWDRWTTAVAACPLVERVSRPSLLPHLRAVDEAQEADATHTLALSGIAATSGAVRSALSAAGPRAVAAGWPAALPGAATVAARLNPALTGYAEALLEARLAMLLLLQGSAPETLLAQNLNSWRILITGEEVTYEPNAVPSSIWSAAEGQSSWVARGILLHLALHRARPWSTGTGRTARLLMNTLVAAAGHPWLSIPGTRRNEYRATVDAALLTGDAAPFCRLLAACAGDAR